MELKTIERKLKVRRLDFYKEFKSNTAGSNNLQPSVIQNIEGGYNYYFASLLKYIKALNLKLYINDSHIKEPLDLGKSIKKFREENDLTQFQVMMQCKFNPSKMTRIEKGTCSRNSLDTLMNAYPELKIEIKEIYE